MGKKRGNKVLINHFLCVTDRFTDIKIMKAAMEEGKSENESLK